MKDRQTNDKKNTPIAMTIDGSSVDVRKAAKMNGHKSGKENADNKGGKG